MNDVRYSILKGHPDNSTSIGKSLVLRALRHFRRRSAVSVTRDDVLNALNRLGLPRGAVVSVHCSLRRLGLGTDTVDRVIDPILDTVGNQGTVLVPTFTWRSRNTVSQPPFDVRNTPSETGWLSESFRRRSTAVRSVHPTHSVAAIGAQAEAITVGHDESLTPFGKGTPYDRLIQWDGWVLLIGVGEHANSLYHAVEEHLDIPHRFAKRTVRFLVIDRKGSRRTVRSRVHTTIPGRRRFAGLLRQNGVWTETTLGSTTIGLLRARGVLQVVSDRVRSNPYLYFASPLMLGWWTFASVFDPGRRKLLPRLLWIQLVLRPVYRLRRLLLAIPGVRHQ